MLYILYYYIIIWYIIIYYIYIIHIYIHIYIYIPITGILHALILLYPLYTKCIALLPKDYYNLQIIVPYITYMGNTIQG